MVILISIYNEFMFLLKAFANTRIITQVVIDYIDESGGPIAFEYKDPEVVDKELRDKLNNTFEKFGLEEFIV